MKRMRLAFLATAVLMVLGACGGGADVTSSTTTGGGTDSSAQTTSSTAPDVCTGAALEATEIGVSASEITIAVTADTGSPIRSGLFQGSVDGIKAWAEWKNDNGGLACRKVVVKAYDSKLSADDAKNSLTSACDTSLALVGTTALFLNDVKPIETCKDRAGEATGITDFAVLQTEPAQQCSQWDFAVLPGQGSCPYSGSGKRDYTVADGPFRYFLGEYGADALHGVWVIPSDLPSTITSSMPGFRYSQQIGIGLDAEFGLSGLSTQSSYTPVVQAIKDNESTYARVGLDYKGTVFLRKEAQVQNVTSVKVWDCSVQCYDPRLITEGGAAMEGQYVWINFLPFEDKGANPTLDAFLEYDKKPDGFGAQAWSTAEAFAEVVNRIVAADGPNGITRAKVLEGARNLTDFTAGGLIPPTNVGAKQGTNCFVMLQVRNGAFTRVEPAEPGTFNCEGEVATINIDPVAEFKP